jgi:hypothetical protein
MESRHPQYVRRVARGRRNLVAAERLDVAETVPSGRAHYALAFVTVTGGGGP